MKLEEYGVSKLTARIILLVIGLIAAYSIFVVINQTRSSSTTHIDGKYIPAKTQAGSDICNEGIDVDLLCIEFLIYEGIDDDAKIEGENAETKIAFNSKYLSEVLDNLLEDEVALETTTSSSPGVIRPVDSDNEYLHVVMPMFVQW